jgi:hypothetical protein
MDGEARAKAGPRRSHASSAILAGFRAGVTPSANARFKAEQKRHTKMQTSNMRRVCLL